MTYDKRFIPVKCLQDGNNLIPFWELNYTKHEDYGEGFYKKGDSKWDSKYQDLTDCYWDSKEKKIITGIVLDVYPSSEEVEYKIGDEVLIEEEREINTFRIDKIEDIIFEEYDTAIKKVKMDEWELRSFTKEQREKLNKEDLYEFRLWKPYYKVASGEIIRWDYRIKKLKR